MGRRTAARLSRTDFLLAAMVIVWAVNFSLVKQVFREIAPMPFNVIRFTLASAVFLIALWWARLQAKSRISGALRAHLTRADYRQLILLGLVGHCAYHLLWATGLSITTASNSALLMGVGPVAVSTAAALIGHERIRALHWAGILTSLAGIVLVVGAGVALSRGTLSGDALTLGAVACWTYLTLAGSRIMARHSPLLVSGFTTVVGTIAYIVFALPSLSAVDWLHLGRNVWLTAAFSGLLSVAAGSLIWYAVVKRVGASRASIYSNLVPLVAVFVAAYLVDEALTPRKLIGAGLVLGGVAMTRLARDAPAAPLEE